MDENMLIKTKYYYFNNKIFQETINSITRYNLFCKLHLFRAITTDAINLCIVFEQICGIYSVQFIWVD